jgi:hypothetical protein
MRLTNTDTSQAFTLSSTGGVWGMPSTELPPTAWAWDPTLGSYVEVAFANYSSFSLGVAYECSSTFTGPGCATGPYTFTFGGISFSNQFQLAAGGSIEYEYGHFTPTTGTAPVGSYTLYNAPLMLVINGTAQDGRNLTGLLTLANSCSGTLSDCVATGQAFTRTVLAVRGTRPADADGPWPAGSDRATAAPPPTDREQAVPQPGRRSAAPAAPGCAGRQNRHLAEAAAVLAGPVLGPDRHLGRLAADEVPPQQRRRLEGSPPSSSRRDAAAQRSSAAGQPGATRAAHRAPHAPPRRGPPAPAPTRPPAP